MTEINFDKVREWELNSEQIVFFAWLSYRYKYDCIAMANNCCFLDGVYYIYILPECTPTIIAKDVIDFNNKTNSLIKKGLLSFKYINGKQYIRLTKKGAEWYPTDVF